MEVARTDAGDVRPALHPDVDNLRVHLQSFHAEDDLDARLLHALRPVDVRSLVETCQQLDDHGHLLAVTGCPDEGAHHLRLSCQAIERNLDALHLLAHGSLLKDAYEGVEVVVGDVDEAVLLPDAVEQARRTVQLPFQDGGPCGITQVGTAAVGKAHEVLVVLVASACQHGVQAVQVELAEDALEQVLRDACVVEDAEGLAALAALHAL